MEPSVTPQEPRDEYTKELLSHPFFAQTVEDMKDSDAYAALQALQYNSENPNENAESYRDEGNYHVGRKEFDKAVTSYTGGILAKPTDSKLLAMLYTNRAIANSYMKNYRSCINDCNFAIKQNPNHIKAYIQAVKCLLLLSKTAEALNTCNDGLKISPENVALIELKRKCCELQEKSTILKEDKSHKLKDQSMELVEVFKKLTNRGIRINMQLPPIGLPDSAAVSISFDSLNKIHWPVLLMYPEFSQTDFFQDVAEYVTVNCCVLQMLSPSNPPPWDKEKHYTRSTDDLEIYFENCDSKQMIRVPIKTTFTELTKLDGFCVRRDLVIVLAIVSKLSTNFYKKWMKENE